MLHRFPLIFAVAAALCTGASAVVFDKPLKVETADTGPQTHYRCEIYRGFMLQAEQSGDGSSNFDVVDYQTTPPACAAEEAEGGAFGYWKRAQVKGDYIFLSDDAQPGEATSIEVFDTKAWRRVLSGEAVGGFLAVRTVGRGVVATIRRSFDTPCSIYFGIATACWSKVRSATGLGDEVWNICREAYEMEIAKNRARESAIRKHTATFTYVAEIALAKGSAVIAAKPGAVTCRVEH